LPRRRKRPSPGPRQRLRRAAGQRRAAAGGGAHRPGISWATCDVSWRHPDLQRGRSCRQRTGPRPPTTDAEAMRLPTPPTMTSADAKTTDHGAPQAICTTGMNDDKPTPPALLLTVASAQHPPPTMFGS
jgi:hypothetical protein